MNNIFDHDTPSDILITCLPELGPILKKELEEMDFPVHVEKSTNVTTRGTLRDTYKMNYWLRTASHVHYKIGTFTAVNATTLYEKALKLPWEEIIDSDGYFSIHSYVKNDTISDFRYANLKLKDAIVDRFTSKTGSRPNSGPDNGKTVIYFHWHNEQVQIYLDTSGSTLSHRGYRKESWKAPVAESLAAGLILMTNWDRKSNFINPMGGSGTLVIEAALIACDLPPGMLRQNYGFRHIKGYDHDYWMKIREKKEIPDHLPFKLLYNDNKRAACQVALRNMQEAGIAHLVEVFTGDFAKINIPEGSGVVLVNPPYGERLGEVVELEELYARIGDFFKQECKGYSAYIFTANTDLSKKIGLRTDKRTIIHNAQMEARLLEYSIYEGSTRKEGKVIDE